MWDTVRCQLQIELFTSTTAYINGVCLSNSYKRKNENKNENCGRCYVTDFGRIGGHWHTDFVRYADIPQRMRGSKRGYTF